ncbi:hypothetical protein [Peteryoungia algae]|uniref:Uncharacterized protein n=1 Tax=Peteryoungia algae TaxID=2919917 RepID=A0ABT0CW36_9HYPH|nr:hypothetical protein [Rhizobium sp. SSM4.3]MCJ8237372.1 hypothetical protein [Rhizobium sp. SSM4.3]
MAKAAPAFCISDGSFRSVPSIFQTHPPEEKPVLSEGWMNTDLFELIDKPAGGR